VPLAAGGRPRVVHVTTTDISLDWLLGPQLEAFAGAGYEVIGASAPGPHVAALEARGIVHVALRHSTRAMAPVQDLQLGPELYRLFRSLRPAIVHTHNPKPGWFGRPAARLARVPVVVNTVHGLYARPEDPFLRRAVVYGLERVAVAFSDAELLQSREDMDTLRSLHVPARRVHHLGNGIDLGRFDPARATAARRHAIRTEWGIGPEEVVCGVVGRLVWEKGLRELFDAARRLHERAPSVRIVVVGPRDEEKWDAVTDDDVARAEADGVVFAGRRDDMVDVYAAFDFYALASYREGFPRSAMEAAAMALPVVATDIRGCREAVDPGVTGTLVPAGDADALANAIERLGRDHELRTSQGGAARAKARREFDQTAIIERTLAVYEELLARRSG
jgi:glycosyltransferase involved in cell wall biosynthesis